MKYNKIAALVKKSRWLDVKPVEEGEQWVGDGYAMFPIYGMPELDNEQIYKFLNLENDKTKISDGQAGMFDDSLFSEDYAGEIQVREFGISVLINGEEYQTLYTEIGALLIKSKYIEIAADNVEIEGQVGIYIRKCGKIPFIAIKKGFALLAIAVPVYTWAQIAKSLKSTASCAQCLSLPVQISAKARVTNMEYNQQAAMAVMRGQHNKRAGDYFEELIARACNEYERIGVAKIEKTPEPFRIVKPMGNGKFQGHYVSQAQPDFKGVLAGGRCIVFDAKHTDGVKIELSRLSETQNETLRAYQALGAYAGVLCSFGFRRFFWLPYTVFIEAKAENGHKYWDETDCAPYEVYPMNGYVNFLQAENK